MPAYASVLTSDGGGGKQVGGAGVGFGARTPPKPADFNDPASPLVSCLGGVSGPRLSSRTNSACDGEGDGGEGKRIGVLGGVIVALYVGDASTASPLASSLM